MPHTLTDPTIADIRAFSLAWLRAIALAWCDDKFREELLHGDPLHAMEVHLGYRCPFSIDLAVAEDPSFEWNADTGEWDYPGPDRPRNEVEFGFPQRPEPHHLGELRGATVPLSRDAIEAVAIADFTDGGHCYLFTCC